MMKFKFSELSEDKSYRLAVFLRCMLAIFAGFAIANLSVPITAIITIQERAIATYTGLLLSFTIWLIYILYVFNAKKLQRIVYITVAILVMQVIFVSLFKMWGMP